MIKYVHVLHGIREIQMIGIDHQAFEPEKRKANHFSSSQTIDENGRCSI
jgi:hypothetical protein